MPGALPCRAVLQSLLGSRFAVATDIPVWAGDQLFPAELAYIRNAVPKRQAEFGTGRLCARRVLAELGFAPCAIIPNADGSPRWPAGIAGSISHTAGSCAAVATLSPDILSVGLDLERDRPFPEALEALVCTVQERAWLATHDASVRSTLGLVLFSAKEAFYKCQYSQTNTMLDFKQVEVQLNVPGQTFTVTPGLRPAAVLPHVYAAQGRFAYVPGLVLTTAVLPSRRAMWAAPAGGHSPLPPEMPCAAVAPNSAT